MPANCRTTSRCLTGAAPAQALQSTAASLAAAFIGVNELNLCSQQRLFCFASGSSLKSRAQDQRIKALASRAWLIST